MRFRILALIIGLPLIAKSQDYYTHGLFWGRLVLADTINARLRMELLLQKRTQTDGSGDNDIFAAPQFNSVWYWVNFSLSPKIKIGVSPFGYFESYVLNTKPSDAALKPVKEFRWSARLEHENKGRIVNLTNRYNLEYRLRDLQNNGHYQPNWRVRYMVKLEKPVMAIFSSKRPVVFTLYDEIFLQFGKAVNGNPNIFDQNRLYIGAAYEVITNVKLNMGYIYGFQERNSGKEFDRSNLFWVILTFDNILSQFLRKDKL